MICLKKKPLNFFRGFWYDLVHQNVRQTGYTLAIKKFSQPRIYSGGIDITLCNELSKEEQNNAISKYWYIYKLI